MHEKELAYTDFNKKTTYSSYNYGTAAYDIDFKEHEKQEKRRVHDEERRKKQIRIEKAEASLNIKQTLQLALAAGVFCFGCVITIIGVSSVTEMRYNITQLKSQLNTVQNENIVLSSEISDTINLDYIEERAKNELGMTEPQSYQIKTISVPEQSYTVQYNDSAKDEPKVDAKLIKEFFSRG
ncbi:MAG: septum formation initiator family protein [Candidatus Metalachnospira sp.]|nr:septum formation initiator family protein [Candidatus Metalachnospira sp.]